MDGVPPYDESQIEVLSGMEAVRRRPGMYFGAHDNRALHQMLFEIMDVSVNEALAGKCSQIAVTLKPSGVITVQDNSEGLAIEVIRPINVSHLELFFTRPSRYERGRHIVSGGMLGVGPGAVNAVSEWMTVEVAQDGYLWHQSYERGIPQVPVTRGRCIETGEKIGISISYVPDLSLFLSFPSVTEAALVIDAASIENRCREITNCIAGLTITFRDERTSEIRERAFCAEHGLRSMLKELRPTNAVQLHDIIYADLTLKTRKAKRGSVYPFRAEFAIQLTDAHESIELGYCNTIETTHGGDHMAGLRHGMLTAINSHRPPNTPPFRLANLPSGILSAISIHHPFPQFESQTQLRLMNDDIRNPIKRAVQKTIDAFAAAHPDQMQRIIDHCLANRSRRAAR